jgi:neurotransmitter:Na+ symporter, NSS family
MAEAQEERQQWGSRIGFILAAMGSAVGFGSLARFPMNVANEGGAVFVVLYAFIMLLVGIPMILSEFSLGRSSQANTVETFSRQTGNPRTKWRIAGHFWWIVPSLLLAWYAIVSGWMLRLAFESMTGAYFDDPGLHIANMIEGPAALIWALVVLALTGSVVVFGIAKGIERLNLVLMPTLFLMVIGLAVYALFLPNSGPGYTFYLQPDFGAVNLGTITAAVGQAFFSLSLAMGAILIYASYLPKKSSLAENAFWVAGSTLVFATICGFMIFPMLASFGMLDEARGTAGIGLILGPLTQVFAQMGTDFGLGVGIAVGTIFFLAVFFASFTSAVSLTEPAIAYFAEDRGLGRTRAVLLVVLVIFTAGILVAFNEVLLDFISGPITDVQVIIGGLILAIFVGYKIKKPQAISQMDECEKGLRLSWYAYPLVKFVMPIVLSILLFFSVMGSPCLLTDGAPGYGVIEEISRFMGGDLNVLGCDPTP